MATTNPWAAFRRMPVVVLRAVLPLLREPALQPAMVGNPQFFQAGNQRKRWIFPIFDLPLSFVSLWKMGPRSVWFTMIHQPGIFVFFKGHSSVLIFERHGTWFCGRLEIEVQLFCLASIWSTAWWHVNRGSNARIVLKSRRLKIKTAGMSRNTAVTP